MYKKIIPYINCENELPVNITAEAVQYETGGADELFLYNYSTDEASREEFLGVVKEIERQIDIPVYIGCYVERFEDIKKALYTGASYVIVKYSLIGQNSVIKEASERFGKDTILLELEDYKEIYNKERMDFFKELGVYALLLKQIELTEDFLLELTECGFPILIRDNLADNDIVSLLEPANVLGITTNYFKNKDMFKAKQALKARNLEVNTFDSSIGFSEFKLNSDGLIPVVVQEYKTNEVLMVAYMNEEAFRKTIETGRMTYFSRSRSALWTKGETSGHFQYVKALMLDCDKDTILAKVLQIGPACHTGNQSCFYTELVKKEYDDTNPLTVFNEVFGVIQDR